MEAHGSDITALAVVALGALVCGMLMRRLRQPVVLGYIVAGALMGPSALGLVGNRQHIEILAELGVLMLLFVIGMELSLQGIRAVWRVALFTTLMQITVGLGAMYLLGLALDWPLPLALVLGFVVALSSTAVAIKMLEEIGEKNTRVGQITIGVLIAQDLAVVPMMLIIASFKGEGGGIGLEALVKVALSVAFLGLMIVYLSRRRALRLPFLRSMTRSTDLMSLAGLAFCFGAAAVSGLLGLSAAYGAFIAGLLIGNSTSRTAMIRYSAPVQSILLMLFFLSIGLLIDFVYIWDNLGTVVVIVTFVAVLKTALNIGLIRLLGETWPRAFLSGVLLAQLGEFSFVLAALGLSIGAIDGSHYRLLVAVTVLSLVGSPIWLEAARRLHRIALLGITSAPEILRLTVGREARAVLQRSLQMEDHMVTMAGATTRWVGDLVPHRSGKRGDPGQPP